MRRATAIKLFCAVGSLLLALYSPLARSESAGQVTHLSGPLFVVKGDGSKHAVGVAAAVDVGDTLVTAERTYARVKFTDNGEVTLRPDSQMKVESYHYAAEAPARDNAFFGLLKGAMRVITGLVGKRGNHDAYRLQTVTATIGIRGTTLFVELQPPAAGVPPETFVRFETGHGVVAPRDNLALQIPVGTEQSVGVQLGRLPVNIPQPPGAPQFQPPPAFPVSSHAPPLATPAGGGSGSLGSPGNAPGNAANAAPDGNNNRPGPASSPVAPGGDDCVVR